MQMLTAESACDHCVRTADTPTVCCSVVRISKNDDITRLPTAKRLKFLWNVHSNQLMFIAPSKPWKLALESSYYDITSVFEVRTTLVCVQIGHLFDLVSESQVSKCQTVIYSLQTQSLSKIWIGIYLSAFSWMCDFSKFCISFNFCFALDSSPFVVHVMALDSFITPIFATDCLFIFVHGAMRLFTILSDSRRGGGSLKWNC